MSGRKLEGACAFITWGSAREKDGSAEPGVKGKNGLLGLPFKGPTRILFYVYVWAGCTGLLPFQSAGGVGTCSHSPPPPRRPAGVEWVLKNRLVKLNIVN